jgi:hypothetical protein
MANSSIMLTNLDFESQKNTLKQYLRSQDRFKDYDFDGSNMSVLLDILTYNTYQNTFYMNMVANELFLDTAQLRDSVVSHAKELNYTPRSFKSAEANVNIEIATVNNDKRTLIMPKGTTFTGRISNRNFTFSTGENIVIDTIDNTRSVGSNTMFVASNVTLYEGDYVKDTFTINPGENTRYILTNKNIDISSITITVIEDMGANPLLYLRASSLFDIGVDSRVFFVQGASDDSYEIIFGDGVSGRKPKDNSVVVVEYRVSNGELPNGCGQFQTDGTIDDEPLVTVVTNIPAGGGSVSESIESIRYNAPRHFTTQERAVTAEDYATLLRLQFPEINAVTAYGGEELTPPQYGRVFVSVDLKDIDGVPQVKKDQYFRYIKPRSPVSITPVVVDPEYLYVRTETLVNYNVNLTTLNTDDIRTLVTSSIVEYANSRLNNFNRTLRYSKLVESIDASHPSIVSNETEVKVIKYLTPTLNTNLALTLDFKLPIEVIISNSGAHPTLNKQSIETSEFRYEGLAVFIEDDGLGVMRIVTTKDAGRKVVREIGTVDYDSGVIKLNNFSMESYTGTFFKVFVSPRSKDITSAQNTILNIVDADVVVNVNQTRE